MSAGQAMPPCLIYVDKEGRWYHQGAEIIHQTIFLWLIRSLEIGEEGQYIVHLNNQKCTLEVEDTPLVIQRVNRSPSEILLFINDGTQEPLDPETLWISRENVLYCKVKGGRFPARFLRPAYYQLAEFIDEGESEGYVLVVESKKYPIKTME